MDTAPVQFWRIDKSAVAVIGWFLVALAVISRTTVTAVGGFYWDDFTLQGRAARLPLDWNFLIYSHDGHIMPAAALLTWVTERAAPLEYWLLIILMVAAQAVVAVCSWLLFQRMFGTRPLTLLLTALFLFSPMTLPGAVWWAAAINVVPLQLGMLAVTWGVWLIQREHRERAGRVWILIGLLGALAFFEKSLFVGLWIILAMWVLAKRPKLRDVIKDQWQERKGFWVALAVIAVVYVGFYIVVSDRGTVLPESIGGFLQAIMTAVFVAVVPSLLGGPVSWEPVGFASAIARPSLLLVLIAAVALFALIRFSYRFSRPALRAWGAAGIYLLAVVVLMSLTRLAATDASVGMASMRYTADALVPIALATGMSIMPLVGDKESAAMATLRNRWRQRLVRTNIWAAVVVVLCALLAVQSTLNFAAIWSQNPAKPWLDNARTSMAKGADEGPILDQQVPGFVLWGLAFPYSNASWALAPLPQRPEFKSFTNNPRFLLQNGRLVAGHIEGIKSAPRSGACGWSATSGEVEITMTGDSFDWEHRVQLDYQSAVESDGAVTLGSGKSVPVRFLVGSHRMVVLLEGGGTKVRVSGVSPDAKLCISEAVVGDWKPDDPFIR